MILKPGVQLSGGGGIWPRQGGGGRAMEAGVVGRDCWGERGGGQEPCRGSLGEDRGDDGQGEEKGNCQDSSQGRLVKL